MHPGTAYMSPDTPAALGSVRERLQFPKGERRNLLAVSSGISRAEIVINLIEHVVKLHYTT